MSQFADGFPTHGRGLTSGGFTTQPISSNPATTKS
jgi:hypothetical protein